MVSIYTTKLGRFIFINFGQRRNCGQKSIFFVNSLISLIISINVIKIQTLAIVAKNWNFRKIFKVSFCRLLRNFKYFIRISNRSRFVIVFVYNFRQKLQLSAKILVLEKMLQKMYNLLVALGISHGLCKNIFVWTKYL